MKKPPPSVVRKIACRLLLSEIWRAAGGIVGPALVLESSYLGDILCTLLFWLLWQWLFKVSVKVLSKPKGRRGGNNKRSLKIPPFLKGGEKMCLRKIGHLARRLWRWLRYTVLPYVSKEMAKQLIRAVVCRVRAVVCRPLEEIWENFFG